MTTSDSVIEYSSDSMRQRSNIFLSSAGFISRIEKNNAGLVIREYEYDTPVYLLSDITAADLIINIDPESGSNFNMFYVGDMIALREEDGTAEPLPGTKEEYCIITAVDKDAFTITVSAGITNSYTVTNCYIYNVIKSELYKTGLDKVITSVEIWRNN